jgi:hypothetical protein
LRGHARNHNLRLAELAQGVIDGTVLDLLARRRAQLEEISDMVGHKNALVTQVVYRHKVSPTVGVGKAPMERMFGASDLAHPHTAQR